MSGEERRLACMHAHVLRNKPRVQSKMKRGVAARLSKLLQNSGTRLPQPNEYQRFSPECW